LLTSFKFG